MRPLAIGPPAHPATRQRLTLSVPCSVAAAGLSQSRPALAATCLSSNLQTGGAARLSARAPAIWSRAPWWAPASPPHLLRSSVCCSSSSSSDACPMALRCRNQKALAGLAAGRTQCLRPVAIKPLQKLSSCCRGCTAWKSISHKCGTLERDRTHQTHKCGPCGGACRFLLHPDTMQTSPLHVGGL